ncbi:amidohydrolase family protein [Sediminispirochaeta smaragdinae]|uniref:Amidohydrolase 2 n=1 Tax=Sediminispirochaeta smaragdinae (strain DSM 11293 / JCM 15392 / SEBR 4228) TaxID=573413 RepID=E1R572_SEDSS|nr:amidohydrolase 2 [Sediminispirochaeta smaragdinae DSM 11293]
MPVNREEIFYDPHCHAMNLAHPNLLMFIQEFRKNFTDEVINDIFSPNYLIDSQVRHPVHNAQNMLAVMEHDIAGIFKLMEDDLSGHFLKERDKTDEEGRRPLIEHGVLKFRKREYRQLVLTPLVMDFSNKRRVEGDLYYSRPPERPLWQYVRDTLEGIKRYHKERPDGILRIYPFLGINTRNYSLRELEELLKKYFSVYSSSFTFRTETTRLISSFMGLMEGVGSNVFSGIKVYPPLGFDPWPTEEPEELEKVKLLFRFCQKRKIPITTHCDDQGYRTIPVKVAWRNSSPRRWASALEAFPELKINFGHYGYQYNKKWGTIRKLDWLKEIFALMDRYDHVYADFSFDGTRAEYYPFLQQHLLALPPRLRTKALARTMFGTDFMVNLSKVRSYLDYYLTFEASSFSDEEVHLFSSTNPRQFLFTEDGPLDRVKNFFGQR